MFKFQSFFLLVLAASILTACSFSESSTSSMVSSESSKSSSASSESLGKLLGSTSSASSRSSETQKQTYERKVIDYTAEFVTSSKGDLQAYRAKISKIAQDAGITNWEADRGTYVSIGKGMRKAELSQPQFDAFRQSLSDNQTWKLDAITEGFGK